MMKALTEFLAAGLKTEQPKVTPQGGDGGTQPFAETMEALLGSTTGGFKKLTSMNELTDSGLDEITVSADSELMIGDFTMDITKPGQDAPKGTQGKRRGDNDRKQLETDQNLWLSSDETAILNAQKNHQMPLYHTICHAICHRPTSPF